MNEYDITEAFKRIEDELIASMIRNMKHHRAEEDGEGVQWVQWQAEQLKALERFKQENRDKYGKEFKNINQEVDGLLRQARDTGNMEQEVEILQAIKQGFRPPDKGARLTGQFFRLNNRKLDALIQATTRDMKKAETAILRMANDQYRKVIYNAQVYVNAGGATYEKAVDMATKDMLEAGLKCICYSNGARHTLHDYADMAIRTAATRAYLQGEGVKRQEWGIATVIVNKRGNPCPLCLPFCGKVLIDDVWSDGKETDGPYPLMSHAISEGLYHPRCKDTHTTFFPGISTAEDTWTQEELKTVGLVNKQEAREQYAGRQAEKFGRLAEHSLDKDNKQHYQMRAGEWDKDSQKRYVIDEGFITPRDDMPKRMRELYDKHSAGEIVVIDTNAANAFAYDPDLDLIIVNPRHTGFPDYDYQEIMAHEIAHRIDHSEFGSPMNHKFSDAILQTEKKIMEDVERYQKLFEIGGDMEYNGLVSDILGCITDNRVVGDFRHPSEYIGIPGSTELEVFANMFTALYQGDEATVEFIKTEMPDLYKVFIQEFTGE